MSGARGHYRKQKPRPPSATQRVLAYLRCCEQGLTQRQLRVATGMDGISVQNGLSRLLEAGHVVRTGPAGRSVYVYNPIRPVQARRGRGVAVRSQAATTLPEPAIAPDWRAPRAAAARPFGAPMLSALEALA